MGKQSKCRKMESVGKGKVTPVQIAFIVDRYLCDNNFSETRSVFRNEASSLISKSPVHEAPKSLLSLGSMLNEYICLKEQKVMVDQERVRLEQEKFRVQTLLQGMQEVMNGYNASGNAAPTPLIQGSVTRPSFVVPQPDLRGSSSAGCPVYRSPNVMPVSMPSNNNMEHGNLFTPPTNRPLMGKRINSSVTLDAPVAAKRSRAKVQSTKMTIKGTNKPSADEATTIQETAQPSSVAGSSPHNHAPNGQLVYGSSVAKSLFNQASPSPPTNSSSRNTPQAISFQNDKSVSPVGNFSIAHCSNTNTPQDVTPNCTVITTERIMVSPCKQLAYYSIERNHCISSSPAKTTSKRLSKRDGVKGRLDFDGSDDAVNIDKPRVEENSTSESDKDGDIFDIDLPNLEAFGANFFSELLVDLDLDCEGICYPCPPALGASADNVSGSSPESNDCNLGADQVVSEFSSTATEMISGIDMHTQGLDSLTAVKSITKCIRILSPAKNNRSPCD